MGRGAHGSKGRLGNALCSRPLPEGNHQIESLHRAVGKAKKLPLMLARPILEEVGPCRRGPFTELADVSICRPPFPSRRLTLPFYLIRTPTNPYPVFFPTDGPRLHIHLYVLFMLHKVVVVGRGRECVVLLLQSSCRRGTCCFSQFARWNASICTRSPPRIHTCIESN
jgi:hypothetical protein